MRILPFKPIAIAGLPLAAVLALSGCSSNNDAGSTTEPSPSPTGTAEAAENTTAAAGPATELIGVGCAGYAEQVPTGPGSVTGMSQDLVTVAASNNPMLTTLTQALSGQLNPDVNLVETLDSGEFTVFAPTDDAFGKLPPETIESLKTDSDTLTAILTYHVVPGQAAPDQVAGPHTTVEGGELTVSGAGDDLTVNDAGLVCGGVKTANATVYMIDTVLMPPAA